MSTQSSDRDGSEPRLILEELFKLAAAGDYPGCLACGLLLPIDAKELPQSFAAQLAASAALIREKNIRAVIPTLLKLMAYVAENPEALAERSRIQDFFAHGIIETAALPILAGILAQGALKRAQVELREAETGMPCQLSILDERFDDQTASQFEAFLDAVVESLAGRATMISSFPLPPEADRIALPGFARAIIDGLISEEAHEGMSTEELFMAQQGYLHALAGLARKFGDPTADFIGLSSLIQHWVLVRQNPQRGRDLAEWGMLQLRLTQPGHLALRATFAWLCWAEAAVRSSQPLVAAQMMIFAHLARPADAVSTWLWLTRESLLAARILRQLRGVDLASEILKLRRRTLELRIGDPGSAFILECDVAQLQVALLAAGGSPKALQSVLRDAMELLGRTNNKERASIVSAAVNSIRILRSLGVAIRSEDIRLIQENLDKVSPALTGILRPMLAENLTADTLRARIHELPETTYLDDVQATALQLLPVAMHALPVAVESGDSELFLLAVGLLSQPSLPLTRDNSDPAEERSEWRRVLAAGEQDAEKLANAYIQSHKPIPGISLRALAGLDLAAFTATVAGADTVMLALDDSDRLFVLPWPRDARPLQAEGRFWSPETFTIWEASYPRKYGSWTPNEDPFVADEITVEEVFASVRSLGFGHIQQYRPIFIFPGAALFKFPFNLAPDRDGVALYERCPVSIVPSPFWLWSIRQQAQPQSAQAVGWLGSPQTQDLQLIRLAQKLTPVLEANGVQVIAANVPEVAAGVPLAIAASHGGTGIGDRFQVVSDRDHEFTPDGFAGYFENCGCVVLFVCSAGVAHVKHSSTETTGLLRALFGRGVRAVVACPWPLASDVAVAWTEPFLTAIKRGNSVQDAAWAASCVVRKKPILNHPSAWAAMHVYGDGAYIPYPV